MTPHIEAKKQDIAKIVLMPGDPLRAKYIAEIFLEEPKLVTAVRNILGYTGKYKGKELTVMASGMGIPSMGIYAYELFQVYDVDVIIRIGSCGVFSEDISLFETILVDKSYTESNFALSFENKKRYLVEANQEINEILEETAKEENIKYRKCTALCNECFDPYVKDSKILERAPKELDIKVSEMESFSLFYIAEKCSKKAACLLTVVDSPFITKKATVEERQNSLNNMIHLALETCIKISTK